MRQNLIGKTLKFKLYPLTWLIRDESCRIVSYRFITKVRSCMSCFITSCLAVTSFTEGKLFNIDSLSTCFSYLICAHLLNLFPIKVIGDNFDICNTVRVFNFYFNSSSISNYVTVLLPILYDCIRS